MIVKSNIVIKAVAVGLIIVVAVVLLKGAKNNGGAGSSDDYTGMEGLSVIESGPAEKDNGVEQYTLGYKVLKEEYGVDVDSPIETMNTLTTVTKAVREDSQILQEKNKVQTQEISKLLKMKDSISKQVESKFNMQKKRADAQLTEIQRNMTKSEIVLRNLELRLKEFTDGGNKKSRKGGKRTASGYDINTSDLADGLGYDDNGNTIHLDAIVWINPSDATVNPKNSNEITMPDFVKRKKETIKDIAGVDTKKNKEKKDRLIKAYTIATDSTLMGSVSMTALLGRIPRNGQVIDPYPFKIIVGAENLSSNGIKIPGISGITMSGVAKGDWTMSCVSGEIYSMTFTFQDGTITTIPEPGTKATDSLAWFSDRYGIPCVTGKRITNAISYLSQRIALSTAKGYAQSAAGAEITTQQYGNNITSAVTGDVGAYKKQMAIASGIGEATDWFDARQEDSFDTIYVPPGTKVELHVTQELQIDYDPEGRKVNHYANYNPSSNRPLD